MEITLDAMAEHRLAAHKLNYSWDQFLSLPGNPDTMIPGQDTDCKAYVIVQYRIMLILEEMNRGF